MQSAFATDLTQIKSSLLLDITSLDQQNLIAVGERGHILTKQVNSDWQLKNSPTDNTLTAVYAINKNDIWAVGHLGTVLHSLDGGESWQISLQLETNSPFLDVIFLTAEHGIAIGAYGLFYRTQDGGETWQKEIHASILSVDDQAYLDEIKQDSPELFDDEAAALQPHLNRIKLLEDGRLILVGELGLIAISDDFGHSWQRLEDIYQGSYFEVGANNQVLVGGLRGHLFASELNAAQGFDWQEIEITEPVNINSVLALDNNRWLLMGNSQTVWIWQAQTQIAKPLVKLKSKAVLNGAILNDQIWFVGDKGLEAINKSVL
ncbi:hypothetical protein N7931_18330 [Catenovulum sp. 2E275]|uniref:WD40/YVTN/BNR-like repeat-containing protein n=1 Tax=Catenovulum sp. 2E275 TaxID=2980497 RepID=UPI0021D3C066|nr:hypothetical protein [Catenovulum sp. 2E275]MCU4677579.1 hypothetical protein [Catenovulum sp. 2E275]